MTWRGFICCFSLWLVLPGGAVLKTLNDTLDLYDTVFVKQFPYQGLKLLHWFANILKIDQNQVIQPLNFQPNQGLYGFHYYGNCIDHISNRRALPKLDSDGKYYAVGNLNREKIRRQFPYYVQEDYDYSRNTDRIVIEVNGSNTKAINAVYITQHYLNRNYIISYDPNNTFEVSTSLLNQIKGMSWDTLLQEQTNYSETSCSDTRDLATLEKYALVHDERHWIDLTPGFDIHTLYCTEDLRESTHFGKEFPRHGLMLLYWFANNIEFDVKGVIRPRNFRPDRKDYGFRPYISSKSSATFLPLSPDRVYFAVGDLDPQSAQNALPRYVTQDYHNSQSLVRNIERIVVDVDGRNSTRINHVYITRQHVTKDRRGQYELADTFRISLSLLRQIQELNHLIIPEEQQASHLQMAYPNATGLTRFLILAGYEADLRLSPFSQSTFCSLPERQKRSDPPGSVCKAQNSIKLEVKSTSNGQARITWSGIPESLLELDVYVSLYENSCSQSAMTEEYPLNGKAEGSIDTSVTLKPGLQVWLTESTKPCSSLWRGPEFDEANGVLPTDIQGSDAVSLQLFTKDGYACARLYIRKSFTSWCEKHYDSWVGFYSSTLDSNYKTYQYIRKFTKTSGEDDSEEYDTYEYNSDMNTGPGVQARLFLDKDDQSMVAQTEPWDGVINPERETHKDSELQKKNR